MTARKKRPRKPTARRPAPKAPPATAAAPPAPAPPATAPAPSEPGTATTAKTGKDRRGRAASLLTAESALIGLAVGIAVVAPWTSRSGYLLLLDWVSGPQQAITPGLYGLDPSALDAMPFRLATQAVRELVGARVTAWLLVLVYFPVAAGGISALAGGGRWRRYSAALFVVCNPFVVERIRAGHVTFLLCVAILTWLFASAVYARRRGKPFAARPAGWYALAMAVGPHGAFLGAAGLIVVALLPRPRRNDLLRTAIVIPSGGLVYLYAAVVMVTGVHTMRVTELDLDAYATRAGPGGVLVTVASLHGFWRGGIGGAGLPRDRLGPWLGALVLAALLATVVVGLRLLWRRDAHLAAPLAALAAVGLVLGAGVNGPAGWLYRFAFRVVPLFEAMREQEKWLALTMIAYAVAVGGAVEGLAYALLRRTVRLRLFAAASGAAAVLMPVACVAPSLVWGLGGGIALSRYPDSWYQADRIMGEGSGAVLFLPWHGYQPFRFTTGRTVATPASAFFRRSVLSSDAVELGALRTNSISRRRAYVEHLIADGGAGRFGRLVAQLGVEYVVLARDRENAAYDWVARQPDLQPVLRAPELDLYRVAASATGRVVAARPGSYADAVALAGRGQLGTEAVLPDAPPDGPLPSATAGGVRRTGRTRWQVEAGPPGWAVVPEEYSSGWRAGRTQGRPTLAGTVAVRVGAGATGVEYTPWRWLRVGLAASLLSFAALVAAGLVEHRRELSGWWHRRNPRRERRAVAQAS
jgi:heme exporter protein D